MRRSFPVLAVVVGFAGWAAAPAGTPSPLAELASSLEPGTWGELSTEGFGLDLLDDVGGHHILQFTDEAVWDSTGGLLLFLGQGHSSNFDGDPTTISRFIEYREETNAWSERVTIPTGDIGHAYDHSAFDAERREFFHRPFGGLVVYRLRLETGQWDVLPPVPSDVNQVAGGLEYFPERNGLLFVDGDWGIWFWRRAENDWTLLGNTNGTLDPSLPSYPMGPIHNITEYSRPHRSIIFGGGNGSDELYRFGEDGSITTLSAPPVALRIGGSVVTTDPVSGNHLVMGENESFWELDPSADLWREITAARPPFFDQPGPDGPSFGAAATPVGSHGVVLVLNFAFDDSAVYVYKHDLGGPLFADGFETGDLSAWAAIVP